MKWFTEIMQSLRLLVNFEVSGNFWVLFEGDKDGFFFSICVLRVAWLENHVLSWFTASAKWFRVSMNRSIFLRCCIFCFESIVGIVFTCCSVGMFLNFVSSECWFFQPLFFLSFFFPFYIMDWIFWSKWTVPIWLMLVKLLHVDAY